jgi:4-alpha-glucanotransferase
MRNITKKRVSGLLLHITSLPSQYGVGDLGSQAYRFADFLSKARQSLWQVLPINPPDYIQKSWSPYNCLSAFAGNILLISPDLLYRQGLLKRKDISDRPAFPGSSVNPAAAKYKTKLLKIACENFQHKKITADFEAFCSDNKDWLEDFALFTVLHKHLKEKLWCNWPVQLKDRDNDALKEMKTLLRKDINREKTLQYLFFKQWFALKDYCNQKGIKIIGDIPIYVAYNSADAWASPEIFKLTASKRPLFIAGVPPDLFTSTGQLWGNPVYNWKVLKQTNYRWWVERIKYNLKLFDIIRLDHFRGFFGFWQVPAKSKTAAGGSWIKGPAEDFFRTLFKYTPRSAIIAEDLGYITADIRSFIEKSHITCTRVLQFGFGGILSNNIHFPENYKKNSAVYTGTHDNNTIKGWFDNQADEVQKQRLFSYLGCRPNVNKIHWEMINIASESRANLVIIPVQDILGLKSDARMNHPGKQAGNWLWQLRRGQITPQVSEKLKRLTQNNSRD